MSKKEIKYSGMAGMTTATGGTVRSIANQDEHFIKILGKNSVDGVSQYSWVEVARTPDGKWTELGVRGSQGFDPAFELNNANATDQSVYKAWRDASTGQLLFFYSSGSSPAPECNCSLILLTESGGTAPCELNYDSNHYGLNPWGTTAPTYYRMSNATLSYGNGNGSLTVLKYWDSANTTKPVAYSWELPYTPTANTPLVLRYDVNFSENTCLGVESGVACQYVSNCHGDFAPIVVRDPDNSNAHGLHAKANVTSSTSGNVTLTSMPAGAQISLNANIVASGDVSFSTVSHSIPDNYLGRFTGIAVGYPAAVADFFANDTTAPHVGGNTFNVEVYGTNVGGTGYNCHKLISVTVSYGWEASSATVGVWPSPTVSYSPFIAKITYQAEADFRYGAGAPIVLAQYYEEVLYPAGTHSFPTKELANGTTTAIFTPGSICG